MFPKKIGHGTYGCVYKPAIACEGERSSRETVSKLMRKEEAIEEKNIHDNLRFDILDPTGKYFITDPIICEPDPVKMSSLSKDDTCEISDVDTLLVYKDGKRTLDKVDFEDFLRILPNIYDGLALLARNGFIHGDVRYENIVEGPDGKGRLIDFGLVEKVDTIIYKFKSQNGKSNRFKNIYFIYPVEAFFLCVESKDLEDHVDKYIRDPTLMTSLRALKRSDREKFLSKSELMAIMNFYSQISPFERVTRIMKTFDMQGLAITMLDIIDIKIKEFLYPRPYMNLIVSMLGLNNPFRFRNSFDSFRKQFMEGISKTLRELGKNPF